MSVADGPGSMNGALYLDPTDNGTGVRHGFVALLVAAAAARPMDRVCGSLRSRWMINWKITPTQEMDPSTETAGGGGG